MWLAANAIVYFPPDVKSITSRPVFAATPLLKGLLPLSVYYFYVYIFSNSYFKLYVSMNSFFFLHFAVTIIS